MSLQSNQPINDCRYYGYKHWTTEETSQCFYVGKGLCNRPNQLKRRNTKHQNVAAKYGCRVEICIGPVTHSEVVQWEISMIEHERTYHYASPNGIGCNFTRGGEGTPGSHHNLGKKKPPFTLEHRQALKRARAEQDMTKHALVMKGKNKGPRPDLVLRNKSRRGTSVRCSKCKELGHNRRGCNE